MIPLLSPQVVFVTEVITGDSGLPAFFSITIASETVPQSSLLAFTK